MPIQPGTKLGAYEVEDQIGQGAMGTVFRAHHSALARDAAVKALQAIAPDPDASARFQREAQAIAKMRHPNVLQVFDFGEFEGTPYMVVEYMPGGSLADRLKAGMRLDRARQMRLLKGLAAALDYAHAQGIVHRDVKPANVLLDADGDPILADFGLAKLIQQASVKTVSGVTTGTPAYMAPEQVMGAAVGPAADVYALTTMAYEFLAGAIPFEGEGMLELLYAHVHRQPPPPSSKNPELTEAVDAVLLRGLAKEPSARWSSCGELVRQLDAALSASARPVPDLTQTAVLPPAAAAAPAAAVAPSAAPGSDAPRRPSAGRRRLMLAAGSGAVAVILVLALLATLAFLNRPRPALALGASRVTAGDTVQATVTGLRPGEKVSYSINGVVLPEQGTANSSGTAETTLRIPPRTAAGTYQLRACVGTACGSSTITVLRSVAFSTPSPSAAPTRSPLALNVPASAKVGGLLTVHGTGLEPGSVSVILTEGSLTQKIGDADANASGIFDWQGAVPASFKAGTATVKACNAPQVTNCVEKAITLTA